MSGPRLSPGIVACLDLDQSLTLKMIYLLIIFIIALALAPLAHFAPSKGQRRVARLREFAAVQGMFVEFRTVPSGALSASETAAYRRGHTIYYGLRIPATGRRERRVGAWVYGEQSWRSIPRGSGVPVALEDLPADIFAATIDEGSCGIFWQEGGEEAEITRIYQVLTRLIAAEHS